ncbi:MAG: PAC2 family protein [Dehalococcoidia bacterium]|nr:PAC2 family protein [Dehalococcoidia bacterium]
MGVKLSQEPDLVDPVLIAAWPGIGNIGLTAVETLRTRVQAEDLGEIEPWEFFYPKKLFIRNGELKGLEFPSNRFFYKKTERTDLILFIAEEQPADEGSAYARGSQAYHLANLVMDVATRFRCRRVYTSGAAVALIHHTSASRVWAVPTAAGLIREIRGYKNTVLMSDVEGRGGQGYIAGLNGLLLGAAKKRGIEGICLMGEVPAYLQAFPLPYPRGSKAVLDVLTAVLGVDGDGEEFAALIEHSDREIERLCEGFPSEIKEQIDRLATAPMAPATDPGPITDEDKKKILDDIDRFFKKENKED